MNVLVFATHNITPEQWADFIKHASLPPPAEKPTSRLSPYVLIHSHSQGDYASRTGDLSTTVKTEFSNATYSEINDFIDATIPTLSKEHVNQLYQDFFMILDEQSVQDRKVTVVDKTFEWVDAEGNVIEDDILAMEDDDATKRSVWKIHRVPYDQTSDFWLVLAMKPGMEGEEFLEETIRPSS